MKTFIQLFVILCVFILFRAESTAQNKWEFKNFITARGDQLFDGEEPFRFISYNIPNLLTVEDNMAFTETNAWRLPDQFEIEDALKTINQIGGQVARTYVITVRRTDDSEGSLKYVEGPGQFNEQAFRVMDQVLASANRLGVRLIIPLVDNWKWMGGVPQYAGFRQMDYEAFWTDPHLREDYKKTVTFILNRVNTITGVAYREDKAILAWELGNELRGAPVEWIAEMAAFIKNIDSNHLVNDGRQADRIDDDILGIREVDLLSTHHYEHNPEDMRAHIRESMQKARGIKPYFIGEFGFISTSAVESVLKDVEQNVSISGALIWSLRFHNRDGGFYWHSEPMGGGLYKAYHWPGFHSGKAYDEINLMGLMYDHAFTIAKKDPPGGIPPAAPKLLPIKDVSAISWQGSVGAESYMVERTVAGLDQWQVIAARITDADLAYGPLFNDHSARIGQKYEYRVRAVNSAGQSEPSNRIGPVTANHRTIVDEMENLGVPYFVEGSVKLSTDAARMFKEDFHRLTAESGAKIMYHTPGSINSIHIYSYGSDNEPGINISVSKDGKEFRAVEIRTTDYFTGQQDYGYQYPILVSADISEAGVYYVKLDFTKELHVGRVGVVYGE